MNTVIITSGAIGLLGLVCAAALSLAARFLGVDEDPRIEKVGEVLPGANCGGCGYAGCADYAKALVADGVSVTLCAPGGPKVAEKIAQILGIDAEPTQRKVALVLCAGDRTRSPRVAQYNGIADCTAAHAMGGDKACRYGCLGYGTCARVCPVDAIEITPNGIAVVHPDLCIGCGACVRACPRNIIKLVPDDKTIHVICSSQDRGPAVKKACSVGCIACTLCTKLAEDNAIAMQGNLAIVDYTKPLANDKVVEKCPGHCILKSEDPAKQPPTPYKETPKPEKVAT